VGEEDTRGDPRAQPRGPVVGHIKANPPLRACSACRSPPQPAATAPQSPRAKKSGALSVASSEAHWPVPLRIRPVVDAPWLIPVYTGEVGDPNVFVAVLSDSVVVVITTGAPAHPAEAASSSCPERFQIFSEA